MPRMSSTKGALTLIVPVCGDTQDDGLAVADLQDINGDEACPVQEGETGGERCRRWGVLCKTSGTGPLHYVQGSFRLAVTAVWRVWMPMPNPRVYHVPYCMQMEGSFTGSASKQTQKIRQGKYECDAGLNSCLPNGQEGSIERNI